VIPSIALLAALAAGTPSVSTGTYRYTASIDGQQAGASSITVARDDSSTTIDESASGSLAGTAFVGKAKLVLGSDLAPLHYDGDYDIGGQRSSATASLTSTSATISTSATGNKPQPVDLDTHSTHFVVIEPGLLSGLFALPAQMDAWKDAGITVIAPAFGQARAIAPDAPGGAAARPADVPSGDVALTFSSAPSFTIWYDPATFVPDEIVVPSQNAIVTRVHT